MTEDAIKAAADLLAMGIKRGRADCFYCGAPGCKCGIERFDRMQTALEVISEYAVDEHADTPRDVMAHIRTLAFRALQPIQDTGSPKGDE